MRLFLFCFLVACANNDDDIVPIDVDATIDRRTSDVAPFPPPIEAAAPDGPTYVGGPLACGKCICDGTLYACGAGCGPVKKGGPQAPIVGDASDDADAADGAGCSAACWEIPVACLPKPTCACIEKEWTNVSCTVASDGSGFLLECQ